jgi:hypothetical protein
MVKILLTGLIVAPATPFGAVYLFGQNAVVGARNHTAELIPTIGIRWWSCTRGRRQQALPLLTASLENTVFTSPCQVDFNVGQRHFRSILVAFDVWVIHPNIVTDQAKWKFVVFHLTVREHTVARDSRTGCRSRHPFSTAEASEQITAIERMPFAGTSKQKFWCGHATVRDAGACWSKVARGQLFSMPQSAVAVEVNPQPGGKLRHRCCCGPSLLHKPELPGINGVGNEIPFSSSASGVQVPRHQDLHCHHRHRS